MCFAPKEGENCSKYMMEIAYIELYFFAFHRRKIVEKQFIVHKTESKQEEDQPKGTDVYHTDLCVHITLFLKLCMQSRSMYMHSMVGKSIHTYMYTYMCILRVL